MSFSLPKEWQDWLNLLLGIWLCVSPWALHFTDDGMATNNVVGVGFLVIVAEVFTFSALRVWEEWINFGLGAWLIVSAWVLGVTTPYARIDFVASGLVLFLLAAYEIWDARRDPVGRT